MFLLKKKKKAYQRRSSFYCRFSSGAGAIAQLLQEHLGVMCMFLDCTPHCFSFDFKHVLHFVTL